MNLKSTILIIYSLIYLVISLSIILFQWNEIPEYQIMQVDIELEKISKSLEKGDLKEHIVKSIQNDLLFCIWLIENNNKWVPIIINKNINLDEIKNPRKIPVPLNNLVKIYSKTINNNNFIVWINKYSFYYYLKYLFIPIILLSLIYLIIFVIIIIIFYIINKNEINNIVINENSNLEINNSEINNINSQINNEKFEDFTISNDNLKILSEYKILWKKNFKISDDFKNNFNFIEIYNLVYFGMNKEEYLKKSLNIASEYFKWENPKFYLNQNNKFIDILNQEVLDLSKVDIPLKGDKKGPVYIPLYPYNLNSIFGYFYFEWNHLKNFYIADILYLLKFIFSDNAKFIFFNSNEVNKIINILQSKIDKKNNEVFLAFLSIDNKENIKNDYKSTEIEILNNLIFNNIKNNFKGDFVFEISKFYYGIISEKIIKDKAIQFIEKFISNEKNKNYFLPDKQTLSITFSCGLSFKNDRSISANVMINEANFNLFTAIEEGGNQVVL